MKLIMESFKRFIEDEVDKDDGEKEELEEVGHYTALIHPRIKAVAVSVSLMEMMATKDIAVGTTTRNIQRIASRKHILSFHTAMTVRAID